MFDLDTELSKIGRFAIYCAGEFASLLVRYCAVIDRYDDVICCVVSERDPYTPAHIMGVPVLELKDFRENKNTPVVVAILSERGRKEIQLLLTKNEYNNQVMLNTEAFRYLNKRLADFSEDIKCELRRLTVKNDLIALKLEKKMKELTTIVHSMPMVAEVHSRSFGAYHGIYAGKNVVLCGAGKSLNQYSFEDNYIHVACNSAGLMHSEKIDYFFLQHIPIDEKLYYGNFPKLRSSQLRREYLNLLKEIKCTKFVGQEIGDEWFINPPIVQFYENNVKPYFFYLGGEGVAYYCKDIRYGLLYAKDSVIFPALQFSLFTNPKKIYLVGCDGYQETDNYAINEHGNRVDEMIKASGAYEDVNTLYKPVNDNMRKRLEELHDFVQMCYPETEIIMVNPQKYNGIFREVFTDENGHILD